MNNTVTATIAHFTTFAVLRTYVPATFQVGDIDISPQEIAPGGDVTINLQVYNSGDVPGDYTATLEINGVLIETRTLNIPGKETQVISFGLSRDIPGTYKVVTGNRYGTFIVTSVPEPTTRPVIPTPPPASATTTPVMITTPAAIETAAIAPPVPMPEPAKSHTVTIIIIVGAVALLAGGVILYLKKRRD